MAIRSVLKYPDPRLKQNCAKIVDFDYARGLARDLLDTLDAGPPRSVGIAASQVGEMSRLAIVDVTRNPKHLSRNGLLVLVNPVITCQTGEQVGREGCMSIPEFTANIKRASSVTVAYSTLDGERLVIEADGFEAVVLQHEIDHLNGIVFLDRLTSEADLFRRASRGMGK